MPEVRSAIPARESLRRYHEAWWPRLPTLWRICMRRTSRAEQERVGTIEPIGEGVSLPFLLVLRLQDGLISHVRDYLDVLGIVSLVRGAMNRREAE